MTEDELIRRLRDACRGGETCKCSLNEAADRIEALTEQLEAARADAKEAEAYAEELERERDEARKYRDAYAECDRIGTQAVRDLETRLAKAVEALRAVLGACDQGRMIPRPGSGAGGMTIEANIRGCIYTGVPAWPIEEARATLAEIGGEA